MGVDVSPHKYTNMKSIFTQQLLGSSFVSPALGVAGLEPASLGANANILPYTPQAQIHINIIKQKKLLDKKFFLSTQRTRNVRTVSV